MLACLGINEEGENEPEYLDTLHGTRYNPCKNREMAFFPFIDSSEENACMHHRSSFKTGWFIMGDLPGYRVSDPGCNPSSYENLPPIHENPFNGTFQWLNPTGKRGTPATSEDDQTLDELGAPPSELEQLVFSAKNLGLVLPEPFLRFMASPVYQEAIFDCSSCWVDHAAKIVGCPGQPEGYIIRFLNDPQDCLFWYLSLNPSTQEQCVLVSCHQLDPEGDDDADEDPEGSGDLANSIWLCASTFEAFLYRFWLENILSTKLTWYPSDPLTSEEQRYLQHYKL
jgi:hypothetical protein